MTFVAALSSFRKDDSGAVTVDWVVLTAAIVGIGIAVVAAVRPGPQAVANQVGTVLTDSATTLGTPDFSN